VGIERGAGPMTQFKIGGNPRARIYSVRGKMEKNGTQKENKNTGGEGSYAK